MMRSFDCHIETASDGEEALKKINALVPNIIVLDLNLPYINGIDLLMHIRKEPELSDSKVIVVTSYSQIQTAPILEMTDQIFHKPYVMNELRAYMRDLLVSDA